MEPLGGLIAIGVFLMKWTVDDCLERFEELAIKTFESEPAETTSSLSITQRIRRMLGAYVRDYQYNSSAIESAFQASIGSSAKMFNPLRNDTKVAVTATTARENVACVFSNYNGGKRPDGGGMRHAWFPSLPVCLSAS